MTTPDKDEDVDGDGVANFGRTPTTGLRDPLLETFIFDFDQDLYGKWLEVQLVAYLRPELKFDSVDDMIARMHEDAAESRIRLKAAPSLSN